MEMVLDMCVAGALCVLSLIAFNLYLLRKL